jgi:hypothetical protein
MWEHPMDSTNRVAVIIIAIILAYVLIIAGVLIWVDPPGEVPETTTAPTTPTTPPTP